MATILMHPQFSVKDLDEMVAEADHKITTVVRSSRTVSVTIEAHEQAHQGRMRNMSAVCIVEFAVVSENSGF